MNVLLYVLFVLSVFSPIYTYVVYPCILRLLKANTYTASDINPTVTIVIVGEYSAEKKNNIQQCNYSNVVEVINGGYNIDAKGEIIVFTDEKTVLDPLAIHEIVKPFSDERVGCVVGQQTNPKGNSSFWKYENKIKRLESKVGCVSGANDSLFAVKKSLFPTIPEDVINKPFYIATKITEKGGAVLYQDSAKAYEENISNSSFTKHVKDATGYWQALKIFPRMLFFKHGSFVYFSHRVMKWFGWLNLATMFVTSGIAAIKGSMNMSIFFIIQVIGYIIVFLRRKKSNTSIGKLISLVYYFIELNIAYMLGILPVAVRNRIIKIE